jgi:hypothetical protein
VSTEFPKVVFFSKNLKPGAEKIVEVHKARPKTLFVSLGRELQLAKSQCGDMCEAQILLVDDNSFNLIPLQGMLEGLLDIKTEQFTDG